MLWQRMSCEHPRQRRVRKLVDLGGCLYLFLNALVCFVLLRETPKLLTHLAKNMFCESFFKCLRVLSTPQKYPEAQKMLTPPSQNHFFDRLHSFTRCIFFVNVTGRLQAHPFSIDFVINQKRRARLYRTFNLGALSTFQKFPAAQKMSTPHS